MYSVVQKIMLNPKGKVIQPEKQTEMYIKSQVYKEIELIGILQPSLELEDNDDLIICPALTTTQIIQYTVLFDNFLNYPYTLKKGCHHATFSRLTPEQAKYIKPINPTPLRHLSKANHDDAIRYVNALLEMPESQYNTEK